MVAVVIPGISVHGRHIPLKQHLHSQKQHAQQSVYRPCCHRFHKGVENGKDARCIHRTRRTKVICLAGTLVSIQLLLKLHSSFSVFSHHTLCALFGHDVDIQDLSCHIWQCCDNPICCWESSSPPWCLIPRFLIARTILWLTSKAWLPSTLLDYKNTWNSYTFLTHISAQEGWQNPS